MNRSILAGGLGLLALTLAWASPAAAGNKVDICHINGNGGVNIINVSSNAAGAHIDHGDHYPAAEVCGDGVDNNCDGTVDEGCTGGCSAFIGSYSDSFNRADGPLGLDWVTGIAGTGDPMISGGEACAATQSVAVLDCIAPLPAMTTSFDFVPNSTDAQEAFVVVADDLAAPSTVYILGCDGGHNSILNGGQQACGLIIADAFAPSGTPELAGEVIFDLVPGLAYTLDAAFTTAGDLEVTLSGPSPGLPHTLTATVSTGVTAGAVGFLVGRDPVSSTCADNFDLSPSP